MCRIPGDTTSKVSNVVSNLLSVLKIAILMLACLFRRNNACNYVGFTRIHSQIKLRLLFGFFTLNKELTILCPNRKPLVVSSEITSYLGGGTIELKDTLGND